MQLLISTNGFHTKCVLYIGIYMHALVIFYFNKWRHKCILAIHCIHICVCTYIIQRWTFCLSIYHQRHRKPTLMYGNITICLFMRIVLYSITKLMLQLVISMKYVLITHWLLGGLCEILDKVILNWCQFMMVGVPLVELPSDECHWTLLIMSPDWVR